LKLKGRLYKSCVRSVMSYESECLAIKKVDIRRMQAAEMRMIRMTCGKTLRDGIPNCLLRDRTGVEDKGDHLGETRLRWFGYLERMDETNLVKRVKERFQDMEKSWNEVMKEDMKKRGLCINDAQDRNKWRRCYRRVVGPG